MEKGKLIVIEGACDGIGKSTQFKLLGERLIRDKEKIVTHHFPSYGTKQGMLVEEYLKGNFGQQTELSAYFIDSLYAIDRAITWYQSLRKLYEQGNIILLDRYTTSSLFYQSALIEDEEEKKKFIDFVIDYEYHKLGLKEPDIVIFLEANFDTVAKLREERKENEGISQDIHERNLEFMKKVYDNSIFVANYLGWNIVKCDNENKMRSIEDIHEDIYKLVKIKE